MLDLTPSQAAGLLEVALAGMGGPRIPALQLPADLGPVLVQLRRIADGATPTVDPETALDHVAHGMARDQLPPVRDGSRDAWRERQVDHAE